MKNDRYLRFILTMLTLAISADAASRLFPIREAFASQTMRCEITNPVKVEGTIAIDTFSKVIRVEIDDEVSVKTVR